MLIIDSKDCENIDKALKKYKKKFEKAKILIQLRERQAFIKPQRLVSITMSNFI